MTRILTFCLLSLLVIDLSAAPPSHAPSSLLGVWQIVNVESSVRPNGEFSTEWMGKAPKGTIIYDESGMMSVQLMRDPRSATKSSDLVQATDAEKASLFNSYYAYFGRYEVDEKNHTVTHHIQGSLQPGEVGVDYKRTYEIVGDSLTLTTETFLEEGEKRFNRLKWKRVKAP